MDPVVTVTDAPSAVLRAAISSGLHDFNDHASGGADRRDLAVVVSDPDSGAPVGGLIGRTSFGVLFVDLVYLPNHLRGSGLGRRLLQQAEDEACRRGCVSAVLETISFQAPAFYERCGYRRFGEIPGIKGFNRLFMTKTLS